MEVNERIKYRRKQLGLSAEQVAERMNVSPSTVYRYESKDIKNMSIDKLEPIANALQTTPAYLMGWSDLADESEAGWFSPLRFWKKINAHRRIFFHDFLMFWALPLSAFRDFWDIDIDNPEQATDDQFQKFIVDTVESVKGCSDGHWDIKLKPRWRVNLRDKDEITRLWNEMHLTVSDTDPQHTQLNACAERLNANGLQKLIDYAEDLVDNPKYQKKKPSNED